jgi:DNA repair exonuclease SbcCD ATPase subunit
MKFASVIFLFCALCGAEAGSAGADTSKDHPIVKVINLLEGLKEKSIGEGKEEAVSFTKFQYWCSTSIDTLKDAIADEKEKINELEDQLAGLNKEKESLEGEIAELEEQIADLEASAKAAKENRAGEAKLYDKANADLESTIKAVGECITALENAESKTEAKLLLAQHHVKMVLSLIAVKVTDGQRAVLESYAKPKARPDQLAEGDLNKHVDKYDFKSENVVELLKQLKLKFEDDKLAGTKAETNALNAYSLSKEARDNANDAAKKSKKRKTTELANTKKAIVDANKVLKVTRSDLKDDSKSLADTEDACRIKTSEWEERSKTRSLEIEAMDQAMQILSKATGVRTAAPGNPVPPPSPVKFLQLSQVLGAVDDPKMKAVVLLREAAMSAHSRALDRLAVEVAAHLNGPFDAVNNMIEKMIFRLMDEQKKEDEHKHWCDQEIKKTETMKEDKDDKIKDLTAEIKVENAAVSKLTNEIAEAEKMIGDIVAFMNEATDIRNIGKKENAHSIKDSEEAQRALTNAISVLTAFYKESGEVAKEPWEFIQKPVNLPKNPATWGSPYTGVADPDKQPGGIISILEGVLSDFSKMESETKAQEAQDQKEFEDAMKSNKIEKAGRTQEVSMKTAEKARRVDKIASLSRNKKDTEAELEKTEQYLKDLKPACVNGDSSYDDRKAARAKEIEALQKAQVILLDAFKEKAGKKFMQISNH